MISVCIATFNGEKYIYEQLKSILPQLEATDEIIISDDGSHDCTIQIIESFQDSRIILVNNKFNKGIVNNIQNALSRAKGDLIFLSDQDDVWLKDKVKVCMQALVDSDLVISDCYITDNNLNVLYNSFFLHNKSVKNKYKALIRNPYLGCCMVFKRSVLDDALPFPKKIPMHDIWIGNVAAFKHKVKFIDNKLIFYRRHGDNASTTSEPSKANFLLQIRYRLPIVRGLIKLFFNI